ncbi:MAG: inositol monophosphatase [Phyllobacteriaceae bacterium]|nr:inositol monophosphatase [Phyllobacteriaceae bacterium]
MARSALLNVMVDAVRKAARSLTRDFGEVENLQVSHKGPADFVSAADRKAEAILREELARVRPGYGFLLEESGVIEGTDPVHTWIVDPLDGTTNFLHGIPQFAISVALQKNDQIVAGVVYNPIMDELYVAERGAGAFVNDRRLRVATRRDLPECVIGTGIPFLGHGDHARFAGEMQTVMREVAGIRRFGSASLDLAWVASGRLDGFWERDLKPWDMAAGLLLVREAGGFVTDMLGRDRMLETGSVLCGNENVHKRLSKLLLG